jgi:transcriptional regulator with XRE-family HTH domain
MNDKERASRQEGLRHLFSEHLKKIQDVKGIAKVQDLAARAGLAPSAVSNFRLGKKLPTLEHLIMLSVGLDCNPRDLIPANAVALVLDLKPKYPAR